MTWLLTPPTLLPPHIFPVFLFLPKPQPHLLCEDTQAHSHSRPFYGFTQLERSSFSWLFLVDQGPAQILHSHTGICPSHGSAVPRKVKTTFPSPLLLGFQCVIQVWPPDTGCEVWEVNVGCFCWGFITLWLPWWVFRRLSLMCVSRGRMWGTHRVRGRWFVAGLWLLEQLISVVQHGEYCLDTQSGLFLQPSQQSQSDKSQS